MRTHCGVIITGNFSHRSLIISKEELPEPTIIAARKTVRWKSPLYKVSSTALRDFKCLESLS